MTRALLVEPAAYPRVGRGIALERAPQIQPGVREVFGGASRVVFTPAVGVVIVRGPQAVGECRQSVSGGGVDALDLVHAPHQTTDSLVGERS